MEDKGGKPDGKEKSTATCRPQNAIRQPSLLVEIATRWSAATLIEFVREVRVNSMNVTVISFQLSQRQLYYEFLAIVRQVAYTQPAVMHAHDLTAKRDANRGADACATFVLDGMEWGE